MKFALNDGSTEERIILSGVKDNYNAPAGIIISQQVLRYINKCEICSIRIIRQGKH